MNFNCTKPNLRKQINCLMAFLVCALNILGWFDAAHRAPERKRRTVSPTRTAAIVHLSVVLCPGVRVCVCVFTIVDDSIHTATVSTFMVCHPRQHILPKTAETTPKTRMTLVMRHLFYGSVYEFHAPFAPSENGIALMWRGSRRGGRGEGYPG